MVIVPSHTGPLCCPRCGTPAVPGGRFCFHCGLKFSAAGDSGLSEAAERRVVTVLFGDLSDFTAWAEDLDPERVGEVTDRVLAALAREVDEVGGRVDNLAGDGIMAVFGAPTAHEDDAERAVRAAAAMQETVRRLVFDESGDGRQLGLRVGINTGEVLAGVQASITYTVIGDTVNTAARLSGAAAVGTVYAGRETVAATRSIATWRELPNLALKGKREPVPAFELVSLRPSNVARPGLGDDAPFLGRDRDLAVLAGWMDEAAEVGVPVVVTVTGEAGIGKTRIAEELARHARRERGARVLWGRTVRHGDGRDLAPLVDVVRSACGVADGDTPARVAERVRRTTARLDQLSPGTAATTAVATSAVATSAVVTSAVAAAAATAAAAAGAAAKLPSNIAERLLVLLGVSMDPRQAEAADTSRRDPVGRDSAGDGSARRTLEATVDSVGLLVCALARERLVVVVIDDLEWATTALRDALRRLADTLSGPVMFVLLDREGPQPAGLPGARRLALEPIGEDACAKLLADYLGGAELAPKDRAALLGRAHGNPFFLTELVNLLVDRGLLHRGESGAARWVLEPSLSLSETALPAGVQSVLAARIDDLDSATKAVLRAAAVLGVRFPAEALPALESRRPEEITSALERLTERHLVRPPRAGDRLWSFIHPMARDVAYAGLPKAERARRHAAAARWAAGRAPEPEQAPGLEAAGMSRELATFVATHAQRAYDLAAKMGLPPSDDAWTARADGFRALVALGRAALARDDHRGAAEALTAARRLGRGVVGDVDEMTAQVLHAEALVSLRRLDEAERALRPALRVATPVLRAAAYAVLGELQHKLGRHEEAARSLLTALDAAHQADDDQAVAATLRRLGLLEYAAGRVRTAEERYREALTLARRVEDPRGVGWALQHLAWSATTRGDYAEAERRLREASDVFQRLDDVGGLGWCRGTKALVLLLSGQLSRAREVAGSLIALAESMGEHWGLAVCLTIDAVAAAELGDVAAAEAEATRAAELFTGTGDTWGSALTLVARGLAARGLGEPDRGARLLEAACTEADGGSHALVGALARVLLGLTHLDAGRVDAAERAALRALADLATLDLRPHALLGAKVLAAQVARARGRFDEAISLLREALSTSEPATLLFPRRQAYAHLAGTLLDAGQPTEALAVARLAITVDAEDVRAQVLAWRALGTTLVATSDLTGAYDAYSKALTAATATGAASEAPQTRRLLAGVSTAQPA